MYNAFNVKLGWLILRVLSVVFVWLTYLKVGPKMIYSEDTGLVFYSLLPTLVAVFLFCTIFTVIDGIRTIRIIRTCV